MGNVFDTVFDWAANEPVIEGGFVEAVFGLTTLDATNRASYSTFVLTYKKPGARDISPATFSSPLNLDNPPQWFFNNEGTVVRTVPINITITAPFFQFDTPRPEFSQYLITIIFFAGEAKQFSLSWTPNFDEASGLAYFAATGLENTPLVTMTLLKGPVGVPILAQGQS